jgi:hypothetical protein
MTENPYQVGDRVIIARPRHPEFRGATGIVKKVIKTRGVLRVVLDNPNVAGRRAETYVAKWENVDPDVSRNASVNPENRSRPLRETADSEAHRAAGHDVESMLAFPGNNSYCRTCRTMIVE